MSKIYDYGKRIGDRKVYYDDKGNRIETRKNILDNGVTYYKNGVKVGTSYKHLLDNGVSMYDANMNKVSDTYHHILDSGYSTYDTHGNKISESYTRDNMLDNGKTTYIYETPNSAYTGGANIYGGTYSGGYGGAAPGGYGGTSPGSYGGGNTHYYGSSDTIDRLTGRISGILHSKYYPTIYKLEKIFLVLKIIACVYPLAVLFHLGVPYSPERFPIVLSLLLFISGLISGMGACGDGLSFSLNAGFAFMYSFLNANLGNIDFDLRGIWLLIAEEFILFFGSYVCGYIVGFMINYPVTLHFNKKNRKTPYTGVFLDGIRHAGAFHIFAAACLLILIPLTYQVKMLFGLLPTFWIVTLSIGALGMCSDYGKLHVFKAVVPCLIVQAVLCV